MVMPKRFFRLVGGFNASFREHFFDVDFCLKANRIFNKKVVYFSDAIVLSNIENVLFDEMFTVQAKDDLREFQQQWGEQLAREIENNYLVQNLTLVWDMECGTGQVLGFTTEALNFIVGLWDKIRIKVKVNNIEECKGELFRMGLPRSTQKLITILLNRPYRVKDEDVIVVIHHDPGRYDYFVANLEESPAFVIGRSMFETDRIPQNWVGPCNEIADIVWVPSKFNMETFSRSGVNITHLDTVPSAIDVFHFDPALHTPLHSPEFKDSEKFRFLSVMKWEPRKAWDVLITAFLEEFSSPPEKDRVILIIRSKLDSKNRAEYQNLVNEFLARTNKTPADIPQILFMDELIPYMKLPALYNTVDCFVLPSHGEGWGLPLMEAMAMEVPTIGTNWSGNTEFMNEKNSYLIQVQKMDPAVEKGHQWASPSLVHLRQLLRKCYSNRTEAKAKAQKGREEIVEKYSLERISQLIIQKLRRIQQHLPTIKQERQIRKERQQYLTSTESEQTSQGEGVHPSFLNLYNTYNLYRNRHNQMETTQTTATTGTEFPESQIKFFPVERTTNRIKIRIID
jgi:glycosyltransferase involved in cell wall biosynthesis